MVKRWTGSLRLRGRAVAVSGSGLTRRKSLRGRIGRMERMEEMRMLGVRKEEFEESVCSRANYR